MERSNRTLTSLSWLVLGLALVASATAASCGSDDGNGEGGNGSVDPSDLNLSPKDETLTLDPSEELPSITYRVTLAGQSQDAEWTVDRADLAEIDEDGVLVPTGRGAGTVTVTATVDGTAVSTTVTIEISTVQNGPGATTPGAEPGVGTPEDYEAGPGGFMGVGGEGLGGAVTDAQAEVLESTPEADDALELLYPYDGTVWPLGMLAPLLMWRGTEQAETEAVKLTLEAEGFSYTGTFGRPAALAADAPFVRHPIPNDVWQMATRSAAGGTLTVSLVVARGGVAYGPLTQTWKVADGELLGCVYYQSYFTDLVDNEEGAMGPDSRFGGATLGIRPGGTDPVLVAGWTSPVGDQSGCRVCHSVSANGARMVVQHGDNYPASSSIDLQNGYAETEYPAGTNGDLGWIGMTPDGALGVGNSMTVPGGASTGPTALYDMETGDEIPSTGLTDFATHAGLPAFSHDGSMLAFNFWAGPGNDEIGEGDERKLVVMDFERDTSTFSNPRLMWEGELRPAWPSFFPDGSGLVFQVEIRNGEGDNIMNTRNGGEGELWWSHLTSGESVRLARANGREGDELYVPTSNTHPDDSIVNFEPTVSPIASGGYAWIVFMSRRTYGNVITAEPYASDPRETNLTVQYSPKKLWIAAIDLDAAPGTDPSYPAIYLPAQEIQASNSRGFWTSDPCVYTGQM